VDTLARRSLVALLAVVALIGAAGCGESEDDGAAPDQEAEASFEFREETGGHGNAPRRLRREGRTLGDSAAVQSSDSFDHPDLAETRGS
jgi:hypothetical protein